MSRGRRKPEKAIEQLLPWNGRPDFKQSKLIIRSQSSI